MGDLKPIGSEKLTGQEKINRIMEIARYNEAIPNNINETSRTDYSIELADGNTYGIVKERQGYVIKKNISESQTEYIEPMKNRKYYSSYSQAFKRLNLLAGELNRLNENEEGVSLFGEQKKFVLKTPKPKVDDTPISEIPSAPPAVPETELPEVPSDELQPDDSLDFGSEEDFTSPDGEEEIGMEMDVETPNSEGKVTFKIIQKLTGKLTQKIRTLDNEEGMTSEDIKYVINMVLSSLDLKSLSEEDKEDIISKFEEDSEDLGYDDMGGEDLTDDSEVEDIQSDMDIPMEGEMDENMYGSFDDTIGWYDNLDRKYDGDFDFDYDEEEFNDFDSLIKKHGNRQKWFDKHQGEKFFKAYQDRSGGKPFKIRKPKKEMGEDYGNGAIIDSIFSESPVDKVISKYFEMTKKEILENNQKQVTKKVRNLSESKKQMKEVIKLSETIEQELSAQKYLEENSSAKIIGKTNKKNLVFENKGKEVKISPEGLLL